MKSSARILDANLTKLLQRAYHPVQPREAFIRDLEQELAPWIRPQARLRKTEDVRAPRRTPWWIAAGVAAAAALLLVVNFVQGPGEATEQQEQVLASLDQLLERGEVALRTGANEPWRAATAQEREAGLDYNSAALELVTPAQASIELRGSEGWRVALDQESRLALHTGERSLLFELLQGSASFSSLEETRSLTAPQSLEWFDRNFHDAQGVPWGTAASDSALLGERSAVEVPVITEEPAPDDETELESPLPGLALLQGTLALEASSAPASFKVSMLREVALPQVAMTKTKTLSGAEITWNGIKPGRYIVYVSVPGHAIWQSETLEFGADQVVHVEPVLEVGGVIRGFVVDKASGIGVAGALVVSESDMPAQIVGMQAEDFNSASRAYTHTAQDGSFELTLMRSGAHHLRANSDEHAPTWIEVQTSGPRTDGVLFELTPGGTIEGRCEHSNGEAFEGGVVIISRFGGAGQGSAMSFEQVTTDKNGKYRVEHLAEGIYVALFYDVQKPEENYQPSYQPVGIQEGQTLRVDFLGSERGASIHGTIYDAQGQPAAIANVHIWQDKGGGNDWQGTTADELGRYEIVGLEPGHYLLYAGEARSTVLGAEVVLAAGDRAERDIHLDGSSLRVGVVDDVSGAAIGFVDLWLLTSDQQPAMSDGSTSVAAKVFSTESGYIDLKYLKPGTYDLFAVPSDDQHGIQMLRDVWVDEQSGTRLVEVRLQPACRATLSIEGPDGLPLSDAKIRLFGADDAPWPPMAMPVLNADGDALFEHLAPGRWRFEVSLAGYATQSVELLCSPLAPESRTVTLQPQ